MHHVGVAAARASDRAGAARRRSLDAGARRSGLGGGRSRLPRGGLQAGRGGARRPRGVPRAEHPPVRAQPVRAADRGRRRGRRRTYAGRLCDESELAGVALGEPRHDDDGWEAKLALAEAERVPVVSFVFGLPAAGVVARSTPPAPRLGDGHDPGEARLARDAGATCSWSRASRPGGTAGASTTSRRRSGPALRAAADRRGGRAAARRHRRTGHGPPVAAVLAAGAAAAQLGTAFMRTPEAGTPGAPRRARRRGADRAHARVHRSHRARDRQPLPARAFGRGARAATRRSTT